MRRSLCTRFFIFPSDLRVGKMRRMQTTAPRHLLILPPQLFSGATAVLCCMQRPTPPPPNRTGATLNTHVYCRGVVIGSNHGDGLALAVLGPQ